MEEFKAYPNKELHQDVQNMLKDVCNPQDDKTRELLEEEEKFDARSDDVDFFVYRHFKKKYPKLEQYAKPLFMMIIKDHEVNMNILQNFLILRNRMYGKKDLKYDKATEIFGKELAKAYLEPLVDDPQELRHKVNQIYSKGPQK